MSLQEEVTKALDGAPDVPAVFAVFEALISRWGYSSLDYASGPLACWPLRSNLDWRPDVIHATYDWSEVYFGTDFQKHDRFLPEMLRRTSPWLYWELWSTPTDDPVARKLDAMAQTRVRSGLSIPFHGPGLFFAGVNLGSGLSQAALQASDRHTRPDVFLAAALLHAHLRRRTTVVAKPVDLTQRERECLSWAAQGKTAWETSTILNLAESTVKKHLLSAAARLDARNRTHAIAIAVSAGLIAP